MAFRTFGRTEHQIVSVKVLEALKTLGDELGLDFKTNGGSLGSASGMIKLNVEIRPAAGGKSHAQIEWDAYAAMFGLEKSWFGETFISQGRAYKITGIAPSRPKFPISAERVSDGQPFKFPLSTVKGAMPKKAAA